MTSGDAAASLTAEPAWLPRTYDGMMVSYAGFGEDVMLRRFFGAQPNGFWIDVGAHDPVTGSITQHFALSGWRGINIEPLPAFFDRLVSLRPDDINLNVAVSKRAGKLELIVDHSDPGLSTATEELAEIYARAGHRLERIQVPTRTLGDIVREHCPDRIVDFLKIDVEGHELEILRGADVSAWRPRVILIEAGYKPERWEAILSDAGYILAGSDPCNRYYVRPEDAARAELLRLPANVGDRYVLYRHAHAMHFEAEWNDLGPVIRNLARFLRRVKDSNPRLKALLKRLAHPFAPRLLSEKPADTGRR
ncbi:MAG: FkbM family methyltransferase [Thermoanaerobaculia bacterium]